ncbi:MAG: hypothetical protein HYT79_00150 [Elusimicrobia bacterium]|nr:hypothetical protein [Elusimicrobiota bacterium]
MNIRFCLTVIILALGPGCSSIRRKIYEPPPQLSEHELEQLGNYLIQREAKTIESAPEPKEVPVQEKTDAQVEPAANLEPEKETPKPILGPDRGVSGLRPFSGFQQPTNEDLVEEKKIIQATEGLKEATPDILLVPVAVPAAGGGTAGIASPPARAFEEEPKKKKKRRSGSYRCRKYDLCD